MRNNFLFLVFTLILLIPVLSFAQINNITGTNNFLNQDLTNSDFQIIQSNGQSAGYSNQFTGLFNSDKMSPEVYGSAAKNRYLGGLGGTSTAHVSVPPSSSFNLTSQGTLELWARFSDVNNTNVLLSKGATTSTIGFYFGYKYSTGLFFRIGGTFYYFSDAHYYIDQDKWVHLAVTWSGAPNYTVNFFVNGTRYDIEGPTNATFNTSLDSLIIGGSQAFPSNSMKGLIDEVRLWYIVKNDTDMSSGVHVGLGDGSGSNTNNAITIGSHYSGLVASWTFNDGTANDYIGGHNGVLRGTADVYDANPASPMPYNLTMRFPGGVNDFLRVASATAWNSSSGGTFDAWVSLDDTTTAKTIISKGASQSTTTFRFGINTSLFLQFGAITVAGNKTIPSGYWTHVAVTWSSISGGFTVKFYVNGKLDITRTLSGSYVTNSDSVYIGQTKWSSSPFKGYIGELRAWNPVLTDAQIQKYMFVSAKLNIPEIHDGYGIAYDFGGNLKNITNTTGVNATFGNNLNKCRFSGYWQEDFMLPWIGEWGAYTTTIYGNYFHSGFFIKASDKTINASSSVKDTINITNMPVTLTSLQVFVSIPNSPTRKLTISLRAPNGTSKILATGHGYDVDDYNGYLTIFDDASTLVLSTGDADFFSPWSNYVHADVTIGNYSSTTINGNWILTVYDSSTSEKAKLMGWGLRPNNILNVGIDPISTEIPEVYNLYQNYPNPFNPVTNIKFEIPKTALVKITVYDILGKEIQSILNENKEPGIYEVKFDGSKLSSGTYFYRIEAGNYTAYKKMILMK